MAEISDGLYNLLWIYPIPPSDRFPGDLSRRSKNVLNSSSLGIPAIILYPAFLTPSILVADQPIEILLLIHQSFILQRENINSQLKISKGLDPEKKYSADPLFEDLSHEEIKFTKTPLSEGILKTDKLFAGMVDKRALKLFREWKYDQLYSVVLKNSCLSRAASANRSYAFKEGGKVQGQEMQDCGISKKLKALNGGKIEENGLYCFKLDSGDIDLKDIQRDNPIQSYHPVYYYRDLKCANFAHVSDIHLSSRQLVMHHSEARVIDFQPDRSGEADESVSPQIGKMIAICSKNLKSVLDQVAADKDQTHALLVGGDLIDYTRNAYIKDTKLTTGQIWKLLALDGGYKETHQNFVDLITFYSLIQHFCQTSEKPVFLVSGNHDCYNEPWGVSPRVSLLGAEITKANEGIPADHNLTIYEAILCFGRSYPDIVKKFGMFEPDLFEWFYAVFTPFSDFSIQLPRQYLVGLCWGDDENKIGNQGSWHGLGHLPRAEEAVRDNQLKLLEQVLDKGKSVILMSHFTFVSYHESVAMESWKEGDVYFDIGGGHSDYDFGTFEKNRKPLYEKYLYHPPNTPPKIQCVVTGHSHRRGLYLIKEVDYRGRNSLKTKYFDFQNYSWIKEAHADISLPAIVVSDSCGPVPRANRAGEFYGWGSDQPSGSKIVFDGKGAIDSLTTLQVPLKPRAIVAFDYMDLVAKETVITTFESDLFEIRAEHMGTLDSYSFKFWLKQELFDKFKIYIDKVFMYAKVAPHMPWLKLELTYSRTANRWQIQRKDMIHFDLYISRHRGRGNFLAVRFGTDDKKLASQYDFDSYWNFEFQVEQEESGGGLFGSSTHKKYIIKRDKKRAEVPDFNWRQRNFTKYQ